MKLKLNETSKILWRKSFESLKFKQLWLKKRKPRKYFKIEFLYVQRLKTKSHFIWGETWNWLISPNLKIALKWQNFSSKIILVKTGIKSSLHIENYTIKYSHWGSGWMGEKPFEDLQPCKKVYSSFYCG